MPPPILSVVKYKGSGSPQAYILNSNVSPATLTTDGGALTAPLESTSGSTYKNHANRIVSAFNTKFWIHRDNIYRQNIESTPGEWESVVTLSPMSDTRMHSGIHLAHPNGIPTLVAMWWNNGTSNVYKTRSTDGLNWTSAVAGGIGSTAINWVGTSLLFGNTMFWVVQGNNDNEVCVTYNLVTGATSRPHIATIGGSPTSNSIAINNVPDILVHQNNLFMWGSNLGNSQANLWRYNGTSFVWIDEVLAIEANAGSGFCLFTNTNDPSTIIIAAPDGSMAFYRVNNPLDAPGSVTHSNITSTVNPSVLLSDPSGCAKYVDADNQTDLDNSNSRPIVYLWHNIGTLNGGQFDLYQWNGDNNAITIVSTGVNIPANEFGVLNIADGGGDRIPTTGARPELDGLPEEQGDGLTKFYFRMYGDSTPTTPTVNAALFFNLDSGAPDTLATLMPGSIIIEDNPNPSLITTPSISATGLQIDNITPDNGATLYSFETDSDLDGIPEGQSYTLMMDLV